MSVISIRDFTFLLIGLVLGLLTGLALADEQAAKIYADAYCGNLTAYANSAVKAYNSCIESKDAPNFVWQSKNTSYPPVQQ